MKRIRVTMQTSGSQYSYEGVPLKWCEGVEWFEGGPRPMQVPCVILETDDGIKVINLQRDYHHAVIEPIPESDSAP